MHLKELNYIVVLADEGSISRAADRLYMAQSSLSQFLHLYESELGVTLFVRTAKGIRPTAAGRLFVDNARTILTHYRLVENELSDIAELKSGNVILGISSYRGKYMLPKILKRFYEKYPGIHVEIIEANSMALEEMLTEGSLDLAVVVLPFSKLTQKPQFLKKDEVVIVTNKNHPIMEYVQKEKGRKYGWINLKDTEKFEYILSDYDTILGSISRNAFKKAGVKVRSYNTNITADLGAAMAKEGLGLAFTYDSCAEPSQDAVYLSIGCDGVFLDLALAHPFATYQSKAAKALGSVILEVLNT